MNKFWFNFAKSFKDSGDNGDGVYSEAFTEGDAREILTVYGVLFGSMATVLVITVLVLAFVPESWNW